MMVSLSLGAIIKPKWLVLIAVTRFVPEWIDKTLKLIFNPYTAQSYPRSLIVQQNTKKPQNLKDKTISCLITNSSKH